ncbi:MULTISPECIES: DUF4755 domain-containing protein [unclassified Luteimonas]|uniref:DUF4755 domain-containing protein n=1 Tax=unclassified Luteimonas TaxID=2629088 RepID=UPI001603882D|nr:MULTISPECIES: DUF4755 domain-containing protein [unclassified Luteimonas]MBB1471705.1 DUF4755 domain-containing protein [Luteimonas sp. MC1782]MBB6599553.1 DUF4755 domain-containing protein [Luteimonas sp. MC1825]QOC87246.1 DUF4755 domain-containing protein [Luteimonas sp. MC1825]
MIKMVVGALLFVSPFFGVPFGGLLSFLGLGLLLWGIVGLARKNSSKPSFGEGFKYSFSYGRTGIAVCPEKRLVKLREKSLIKEYPFEMIRSWESNIQSGGMAVHGGSSLAGASNVGAANLGRSIANRRASGFFVYTKDIDNTTWRVEMFQKKEQAKWMEILQQCVNEG